MLFAHSFVGAKINPLPAWGGGRGRFAPPPETEKSTSAARDSPRQGVFEIIPRGGQFVLCPFPAVLHLLLRPRRVAPRKSPEREQPDQQRAAITRALAIQP